jgi:nitrogen fixation/metabolism regulation signal transduction histidine kinase
MGLYDALFGSPQALYAGYAIVAAIIVIVITIVLTRTDLTVGNRFLFIFLVVLMLIPSVFLTLLQLTCMVTGGNKNQRWWCWLYAWIVSIFIIIYCIFVIIISFMTLFTYTNAMNKVDIQEKMSVMNPSDSNNYANSLMQEGFANKEMAESEVKVVNKNDKEEETKKPEIKSEVKHEEKSEVKQKFTNPSSVSESVSIQAPQSQINQLTGDEEDLEPFTNPYSSYSRY